MKENGLRKHAVCSLCHKPIGWTKIPLFWTVRIERHGIKMDAIRRQDGLTAMLGGRADIAQVMGTDEEMTMPVMDPIELTLCEMCAVLKPIVLATFLETKQ